MDWAAKGSKKKKHQEKVEAIKESLVSPDLSLMIAKKDFKIVFNDYVRVIKAGESLIDIPEIFHANLKTEGVL